MRIGLTGGIGAGKSTVARLFTDRGIPVIDADAIARAVVEPGAPALVDLETVFGPAIIQEDGSLDRPALAAAAFADAESKAKLDGIMHPAIGRRTAELFEEHANAPIVVHDVPLLVENAMSANYHLCILVDVPARIRIERLVGSRGMDEADARRRIDAQATDAQRYPAVDVVLSNAGTPEELEAAFEQVYAARIVPFAYALAELTGGPVPEGAVGAVEAGAAEAPAGGRPAVDPRTHPGLAERLRARGEKELFDESRLNDVTSIIRDNHRGPDGVVDEEAVPDAVLEYRMSGKGAEPDLVGRLARAGWRPEDDGPGYALVDPAITARINIP